MKLPPPVLDGNVSVERAIHRRRTARRFSNRPLEVHHLSQILWSAQGITDKGGEKRSAPSGGALYPAHVYAMIGEGGVEDLDTGVYRYEPTSHVLVMRGSGDRREDLAAASLGQMWMARAPVILVVAAQYSRITVKYGERGVRYALMEIGHICQNIFLQCQALNLKAGIVGAFNDIRVAQVLAAEADHDPLSIMPVGGNDE